MHNFRAFIFFIFVIFSAVLLLLEDTVPNLVKLPLNYAIELLEISSPMGPGILVFSKLQNDAHEARCRTMQRRPIHNNEFLAFDEYTHILDK